jgi:hypothetical protein
MSCQQSEQCAIDHHELSAKLDAILDEQKKFAEAFPKHASGDPDFGGHRDYHESLIRSARAQELFWLDIKKEVVKKGILALVIIVLGLIVVGAQAKLKAFLGG